MKIVIKEPLYKTKDGVVVGIRDKYVYQAEKKREPLIVICQDCKGSFSPSQIKKNPFIEKVFKYPEPMKLFKIFLPIKKSEDEKMRRLSKLCL